ncbi:MAG TPA: aldolase/citrate lyase family protein [Chloroflexota bacterium]
MTIRTNPMHAALAAGRVQLGTWINLVRNPAMLALLKSAGFDYARVDMEHSSPSIETVADMAVLARALDFPLVVRPPEGNREWITRLLDVGVWGLHVPQVDTPEIAHAVAQAARYAPVGRRGMAGLSAGTDFDASLTAAERLAHLNRQVHVTVMLETAEAFRHLDDIASIEGIDAITLGPTDLAQDLGVFGTPRQAAVLDEHRQRLIAAARAHGKHTALLVDTVDEARRWIDAGASIIAFSSDVVVLRSSYAAAIQAIRQSSRP